MNFDISLNTPRAFDLLDESLQSSAMLSKSSTRASLFCSMESNVAPLTVHLVGQNVWIPPAVFSCSSLISCSAASAFGESLTSFIIYLAISKVSLRIETLSHALLTDKFKACP